MSAEFVTVLDHLSYISYNGSIHMIVTITIERFVGICFPMSQHDLTRRSWQYISPVILIVCLIYSPRLAWQFGAPLAPQVA